MKRATIRKRRDRRLNLSPYHRFQKSPFQYSAAYYAWRATVVGKGARRAGEHRAAA